MEILARTRARTSAVLLDLLDELGVDLGVANRFRHGEMLKIVVRLKQGVPGEKLDDDAADAPDVARKTPPELEDDLRCTIVSGGHHR